MECGIVGRFAVFEANITDLSVNGKEKRSNRVINGLYEHLRKNE
jgi:hypothetical protein